jgi:Histidine kinase-, DNA gyrase B-, and HSP90-like ATPase
MRLDHHVLYSLRNNRDMHWGIVLSELADNALGAAAQTFIASWDGAHTFVAEDDGHGVSPDGFEALYTLGGHIRAVHRGPQPGRYGIGFKEAAGWLWGTTTILSVHEGRRRRLIIDWEYEASKGLVMDTRTPVMNLPGRPGGRPSTRILCEGLIRETPGIETLQALSREFAHIYRPALEGGFRMRFRMGEEVDLSITPTPWPTMAEGSPEINRNITVAGREVHVRAYVTATDQEYPGIHFGCEGRAMDRLKTRHKSPRLYGWVTLGSDDWEIGKNKTEITDRHRGLLMSAVERVCRPVLEAAAQEQQAIVLQELRLKLEEVLRDGLAGVLMVPETMVGSSPLPDPPDPPGNPEGPAESREPHEPSAPRPPRIEDPTAMTTQPDQAPKIGCDFVVTRAGQLIELDLSNNRWTVLINRESRFVREFLEEPVLGARGIQGMDRMRLVHTILDTLAAAAVHDDRVAAAMPWLQGAAPDVRYGVALAKLWDGILARQHGPLFEPA